MNAPHARKESKFNPLLDQSGLSSFMAKSDLQDLVLPDGVSTASGRALLDKMADHLVTQLQANKATSIASGDRRLQALAIAEIKLLEFIRSTENLVMALGRWTRALPMEDRAPRGLNSVRKSVGNFVQKMTSWRQFRQGPDVVKRFSTERVDLAERIKLNVPKESHAWALEELKRQPDLGIYVPELVRINALFSITNYIVRDKMYLLPMLAMELVKQDDMDAWTLEQLVDAMMKSKDFRSYLADEIYGALVQIYVLAFSHYWDFINQEEQLENGGMYHENGLCLEDGAPHCQCKYCKNGTSFKQTASERLEWLDKTAGAVVVQSKSWGIYAPLVQALGRLDIQGRKELLWEMTGTNCVLFNAGKELAEERRLNGVTKSEAHKERKKFEKDLAQARARHSELERTIEQMRKARDRRGDVPAAADTSSIEEELKQAKKMNELLRTELGKKDKERERVGELLRSILSSTDSEQPHAPIKLTPEELRQKRGVVIGGHYNLVAKLRKELPNCTYYSPDVKSLDEDAVRNSEYILFFTGYVNHCLTGHALRLSRLHNIPCGYTDRTNVNLVLEDVAAVFETS